MSLALLTVSIGLPTLGALAAWRIGFRAWQSARSQIPPGPERREARGKVITLLLLPTPHILFGLVIFFLLLGEKVPDTVAWPAAFACSVPGLLSGLGMAIIFARGFPVAVASEPMFGRVLPLAVKPETSAVFGLVVSLSLIRGGANPVGGMPSGADVFWLASALAMVGGLGAPAGAWLAVRTWDFKTIEAWPKALSRTARGDYVSVLCLALAMAVLAQWLLVVLIVAPMATLILGSALILRRRQKRLQGGKGT